MILDLAVLTISIWAVVVVVVVGGRCCCHHTAVVLVAAMLRRTGSVICAHLAFRKFREP